MFCAISSVVLVRSSTDELYKEITDNLDSCDVKELEPVALSTARRNSLAKVVDYLSDYPQIIVNGFIASGTTPSTDAGKAIVDSGSQEHDNTSSSMDEDEISDEEYEADESSFDDQELEMFSHYYRVLKIYHLVMLKNQIK